MTALLRGNAAAFLLALVPALAAAQTSRPGLPFITVDALVGGANIPVRSGATFYDTRGFPVARVNVAVRLGTKSAFRPVAVLDDLGDWGRGDVVTICNPAPNGSCKQPFPDLSGVSLGLGVRNTLGTVVTGGVTGGIGRYKLGDNRPETLTGFHIDAELALRLMKNAGMVLNIRHVETGKYQGARMWFRPITFGIRLQ